MTIAHPAAITSPVIPNGNDNEAKDKDGRMASYLETIPDDIFINIASRLDLPSLMNLETNRDLQSRVRPFTYSPMRIRSDCSTLSKGKVASDLSAALLQLELQTWVNDH